MARGQQEGNAAGPAAEAFSEGAMLCEFPGPRVSWDTPHYPGDNDFDDAIDATSTGWKKETAGAAPQSKNEDTVG